ncbi:hypothetical protein ANCDUO_06092 [Ancylostoma duodenale]|uniref:Uncharacterized protein n=1 Tax=Ancylostoma duodenale TaxID=51022 RepID=A0A0C2GX06_9BILA|nr:hypothetical protein ANCDUO_06092 [Ancylostoma duodenale]
MVSLHSEDDYRDHNMALRYRLYSRLDPGGQQLRMPDHVIPSEYFSILPFDDMKDSSGKQSSLVTIFSLWNTMMGTSLLAMPWALQQLLLGHCGITNTIYAKHCAQSEASGFTAGMDPVLLEFSDVCRYFLGRGEALQPNSSTIPVMENKTFTCDVYCPMDESLPPLLEERGSHLLVDGLFPSSWDFDQLWQLQNFLNNFGAGDILSSTARMFLLFQMITVLPLLMFLIRSQLCYAFLGKTWPG